MPNAAAPVVASAYVTEVGYNEAKLTVFVNAQIASRLASTPDFAAGATSTTAAAGTTSSGGRMRPSPRRNNTHPRTDRKSVV